MRTLILLFSVIPVAVYSVSSDTVHVCSPLDYERWRQSYTRPAGKPLANLLQGEPQTVRMIYFLPSDRMYRQEVVDSMKTTILRAQTFFSDQMESQGYGTGTFDFDTDSDGAPLVHRLDGQHPDSYYFESTLDKVMDEVGQVFDLEAHQINFLVIDNSVNLINLYANGVGGDRGKSRGDFIITGDFRWSTAVHELGHAFGLRHDFRDGVHVMSYGTATQLSSCSAGILAVHPYFSGQLTPSERLDIQLLTPVDYTMRVVCL